MTAGAPLLGVVLAGGESRRFGSPKALTEIGGVTMARRAADALEPCVRRVGFVANDARVIRALAPRPVRRDRIPGLGPVGGILTALHWAREEELEGALVLACDLPLMPPEIPRMLAARMQGSRAVVASSPGPLGVEPLCAGYSVEGLDSVEAFVGKGGGPAHRLLEILAPRVIPLEEVARVADPERAFLNVNTPRDAAVAGEALAETGR